MSLSDPFEQPLLDFGVSKLIDEQNDIKIYKCNLSWFLRDILPENYIYQRNIDDSHVMNLLKAYKSKKYIFIHDGFKLAKLNDKFYLVDGQHRIKALEKINKNKLENIFVIITIYNVKNLMELQQLFRELNNGKPIHEEELIKEGYLELVECIAQFRKEITEHDTGKEGFISKRRLAQFLQTKNLLESGKELEEIINQIKIKNINMTDDPTFQWIDNLFEPIEKQHWKITEKTRKYLKYEYIYTYTDKNKMYGLLWSDIEKKLVKKITPPDLVEFLNLPKPCVLLYNDFTKHMKNKLGELYLEIK